MKILITGTSKGIGRACAILFLNMGHTVYGMDILGSTIDDINYEHYKVDIRDDVMYTELMDIDILINNAGVQDSIDDIDSIDVIDVL